MSYDFTFVNVQTTIINFPITLATIVPLRILVSSRGNHYLEILITVGIAKRRVLRLGHGLRKKGVAFRLRGSIMVMVKGGS